MRLVQNLALFGLWGGTALLFWGMTSGNSAFMLAGAGLGILVGVPAAYTSLVLRGKALKLPSFNFKLGKQTDSAPVEEESKPVLVQPKPQPAPQKVVSIPVRVVEDEPLPDMEVAPLPQPEGLIEPETEPEPEGMTHAEREDLVKQVHASTDVDQLTGYVAHEDDLVRLYAVQRLGDLGDQRAGDVLIEALEDEAKVVSRAARIALHKVGVRIPEE